MKFDEMITGEILDTTRENSPVWCEKCGLECETEAIIKNGKPYHYTCSGLEF